MVQGAERFSFPLRPEIAHSDGVSRQLRQISVLQLPNLRREGVLFDERLRGEVVEEWLVRGEGDVEAAGGEGGGGGGGVRRGGGGGGGGAGWEMPSATRKVPIR